jgi:putative membrane protein
MEPNFTLLMATGVAFATVVLGYFWWRFGAADMLAFAILSGGFTAIMDLLSTFVAHNYEYPGQSPLWVFTFIFFGWIGMCGSSLLIAEGILCRRGEDILTGRGLLWQAPLLTAVIAVVADLFIDPVAVAAGYWVWFKEANVYYGIPLLNFVGWFVLMGLAPLAWIAIARRREWPLWRKGVLATAAIVPLSVAAVILSMMLNGALGALGWY